MSPLAAAVEEMNQLEIALISISDVGMDRATAPSVYAIYQFRDRPHHHTQVHEARRHVDFDATETKTYPVRVFFSRERVCLSVWLLTLHQLSILGLFSYLLRGTCQLTDRQ